MATAGGPNIERDGLVFGYDTSYGIDTNSISSRFYPGEPTTNLLPSGVAVVHDAASGNAVTVTDATNEKGPGWKKVTITTRGSNYRALQWTYLGMSANITYTFSAVFDWGNLRGKNYFIYFDGSGTGGRTYYRPGDYSNAGSGLIDSTMPDGKFAGKILHSGTHTHSFFIGNYTTGVSGLNDYFYYKEFQAEVNSHPTPYSSGTRSSTQSLIDLTRTSTINVSNVSFDLTGQPTFDGTDDRIVSDAILVEGSQTFETVFMATENPHSPAGILTNHQYTSPQANFGINYVSTSGFKLGASIGYTDGSREYDAKRTTYVVQQDVAIHAVLTYDETNNRIKWYINGELDSTHNLSKTPNFESIPVCSGRWTAAYNDYYFDGYVYLGKIYNKELSADEVQQNYNAYKNRFNL
jgi:hypothetical protein